ncbi:MAG: hypothetical protein VX528_16970, partial [Candidatus Latescibacterota bacterium]|nr:hypothetical protein [Candidatus Latescibacterota bacterium]
LDGDKERVQIEAADTGVWGGVSHERGNPAIVKRDAVLLIVGGPVQPWQEQIERPFRGRIYSRTSRA